MAIGKSGYVGLTILVKLNRHSRLTNIQLHCLPQLHIQGFITNSCILCSYIVLTITEGSKAHLQLLITWDKDHREEGLTTIKYRMTSCKSKSCKVLGTLVI